MAASTLHPLPPYPSTHTLSSLPPSARSSIKDKIATALQQTLALPPSKLDTPATREFLSSYLADTSHTTLDALIWPRDESKDATTKAIRARALRLAQGLSSSLPPPALLDLCIVYAPTHLSTVRTILASSSLSNATTSSTSHLLEAFTTLLSPDSPSPGLHALRKTSHALACLLRAAPPPLLRGFAHSVSFLTALARVYDAGLSGVARSYGFGHLENLVHSSTQETEQDGEADEWTNILLQTKVALLDAFHVLLQTLLTDLTRAKGVQLAVEADRTFGIVFALLDVPPSSSSRADTTPFLDRPLLADYEHAYGLSSALSAALASSADDARPDLLAANLRALNADDDRGAGALKLLLRGSGAPPRSNNKGKGKSTEAPPELETQKDGEMDDKVEQVLAILPDHPPETVRAMLRRLGGVEAVVGALLEGGGAEEDAALGSEGGGEGEEAGYVYTSGRQNVWDGEEMDLGRVHRGKRSDDPLRDRAAIAQLKADILRRAEEISSDEEDEENDGNTGGKMKARNVAYEDEDDELGAVRVRDGEGSGDDDDSEGEGEVGEEEGGKENPETILERTYLADPALFARDAATRRGKERVQLRAQTGWTDEQIEGWKIMLERNPKKDRILAKHEFAGNVPLAPSTSVPSSGRGGRGGRGSHGRGQGRGSGRGGGGQGGSGGGGDKERAWKEKRGNQARKRGRDRKVARAGGPA